MQVMSPQMQQSLAFLQAPMLDLRSMINKELQENPVLEELSPDESAPADSAEANGEAPEIQPPEGTKVDPTAETPGEPVDDFSKELERLAEMSEEWRDHFNASQVTPIARPSEDDDERRQFMMESITSGTSLQDLLMEQSKLSDLDLEEMGVAEEIIGNIDDNGFLQVSVEELMQTTGCDREVVEETLSVIRSFEPAGVGACDLRECLLLQLERQGKIDSDEYKLVENHMDALGRRRFPEIAKALGVDISEVQEIAGKISRLDPRPGSAFQSAPEQYVLPEVFVSWKDDQWEVTSNREEVPQLRISNSYKDLLAEARDSKDVREYIRSKIRDGNFLIKSIHQRQDTILNIAREIVARQGPFMEEGVPALKPMTMSEIAEAVDVHETTVSRAVSGKYMKTPQGLFEMRFFFTGAIATASGKGVSNTSVKQMIADLVEDEDKAKPLSYEQLVKLLGENEIKIARRTVAKYRGELGLLSSSMRKVY